MRKDDIPERFAFCTDPQVQDAVIEQSPGEVVDAWTAKCLELAAARVVDDDFDPLICLQQASQRNIKVLRDHMRRDVHGRRKKVNLSITTVTASISE